MCIRDRSNSYYLTTNTNLINQITYRVRVTFSDNKVSETNQAINIDKQIDSMSVSKSTSSYVTSLNLNLSATDTVSYTHLMGGN